MNLPTRTVIALLFVAGLALVLSWPIVTALKRESLMDKARALRSVEPHGVGADVRFRYWTRPELNRPGADIDAIYEGPWRTGGFSITLTLDAAKAKQRFVAQQEGRFDGQGVQVGNVSPSEACFARNYRFYCIGHHSEVPALLSSWTFTVEDSDNGLDALTLLRNARKHIVRVFPERL